uniref:WD repeat domain phosphoinositide-interacting protein 2 n=1 Tax=Acrobeloides nanus TaxID=290746 RepID=A0A914EMK9_9BILA
MVGTKTAVAMPRIGNQNYLVVATSDGYLFCYTIEPEGGECTLMRQYRIGPLTQEEIQQQQQNSAGQVIIAGSAGNVVNEAQKLYPNLTQEQHEAAAPSTIKTPPLMVPVAAGSARQISTSPPSLTSAALSSSPGGPIQPLIPRKMATPVKATATVKAASPASNQNRASPRHDSESGGSSEDLAPLGDLNDLDEFPPLNHATS